MRPMSKRLMPTDTEPKTTKMAAALPEHRLIFSRMRGREHCLACCVDLGAEEHLTDEPLKQPNTPLIGQGRRLEGNVREPRSNS